jgi:hypothetical protein
LQALVKSVYSRVAQEDLETGVANVSPGCRREMNELRRRLINGRADGRARGAETSAASTEPVGLDDVLDALRRASLAPMEARIRERSSQSRGARGFEVFAAEKPTKFDGYGACYAIGSFPPPWFGNGCADAAADQAARPDDMPRDRAGALVVSSNRLPLPVAPPPTFWAERGRGNIWDMLCDWFRRLLAPGAYASFRQNLIGDGFAPLTLALRARIGKSAPLQWRETPQLTHMRALLPRPHAGGALRHER